MGVILKLFACAVLVGGLYIWTSGKSVTEEKEAQVAVADTRLTASAFTALAPHTGSFDETGTIVIDPQGQGGTYYILYTHYTEGRDPEIHTKRLTFPSYDRCAEMNVSCATNQPHAPFRADEHVRVAGTVDDDRVSVDSIWRL